MNPANLKVYFMHHSRRNHVEVDPDNENLDLCYETRFDDVEIKEYSPSEVAKVFDEEDGDGDETGSWSKTVFLITNDKNKVLFNPQDYKSREDFQRAKDDFIEHYKALEVI